MGQRNYFTIFFRTLRQSLIFIPGIKNDLCIAISALEGKVRNITLLLPVMDNTATMGSW